MWNKNAFTYSLLWPQLEGAKWALLDEAVHNWDATIEMVLDLAVWGGSLAISPDLFQMVVVVVALTEEHSPHSFRGEEAEYRHAFSFHLDRIGPHSLGTHKSWITNLTTSCQMDLVLKNRVFFPVMFLFLWESASNRKGNSVHLTKRSFISCMRPGSL